MVILDLDVNDWKLIRLAEDSRDLEANVGLKSKSNI
jgi:hypothetical protein